MLYTIHVRNLALIEEQEIQFGKGLNILTGETGAGKSVLLGSIGLALGAKADKDMIRTGCDQALVELTFGVPDSLRPILESMELTPEEDGTVLIQRRIMENRSVAKVNGESVTTKQLRELGAYLINVHGQNDHTALLHEKEQLRVLDEYAGEQLLPIKAELGTLVKNMEQIRRELESSDMDESQRRRAQDLARFEAEEIENAALVPGEDESLERDYHRMQNGQKITSAAGFALDVISGDGDGNLQEGISRILREINSVSDFDEKIQGIAEQLTDVEALLEDAQRDLSSYLDDFSFDEEAFAETENRLNLINHLKDKYGNSIDKIIAYGQERQQELEKLEDLDAHREQMQMELQQDHAKALALCNEIHQIREKEAGELSRLMKQALIDLNFLDVQFEIDVTPDPERIGNAGYDSVCFRISTNPGEAIRPLSDVASGGELSRIMLALKTVLAGRDEEVTFVFDEIDAGISGKTAWKVSEKLGVLALEHQILCITHLPQIAAMADSHFFIEKKLQGDRTVTQIRLLEEEESARELGRMLGGAEITDAVLQNAEDMKKQAALVKMPKNKT